MTCLDCTNATLFARNLCRRCYTRHWWRGDLDKYPRKLRNSTDTVEEMLWAGFDPRLPHQPQFRALSHRLDTTPKALAHAWYRAGKRGAA